MICSSSRILPHHGTGPRGIRVVVQSPGVTPAGTTCNHFGISRHPAEMESYYGASPWGAVFGLAITLGVGLSFWTGIGLLIARLWR